MILSLFRKVKDNEGTTKDKKEKRPHGTGLCGRSIVCTRCV
nr:MAG TPA: hypothetical protein [Caudoviricetes sp.]